MSSKLSLHRYLLTRILLCVVPIVIVGMVVHWYFGRRLLQSQFDEHLVEKAMTLATLITQEDGKLRFEFADEFMPQYSRAERPYVFQVWYPDGRSLERSYSLHGEDLPFLHGPLEAPVRFETTLTSGVELRCVGIECPARLGATSDAPADASAVIVLGAEPVALEEKLEQGYTEVAVTGIVTIAGIAIFVVLALRRGVHLIRRIVSEVEHITPSTLRQPLDEDRAPLEIRPIVASLNGSLRTIHGFVERERRFTADVAHELRTPIAELRAAADVAHRWPDAETHERLRSDARAIAMQMGSLVESLLELATLEAEGTRIQIEEMDLAELVARIVEQAARTHPEDEPITFQRPESLKLASQPRLWEVAVRNLIDNALEYSPPGSRVHVLLRPDGDGALVDVSNPADSLDPESVQRCTERLWRANREQQETRHFGLGLSIVQGACAKLGHRFSVRLEHGLFHATIRRTGDLPANGVDSDK